MKMTERITGGSGGGTSNTINSTSSGTSSNRKHRRHKNNKISIEQNNSTTESMVQINSLNGQSQSNDMATIATTPTTKTKSLKLVLKVGQSGSYSPAATTNNSIDIDENNSISSANITIEPNSSTSKMTRAPPELLPLHNTDGDSYHPNVDFNQMSNSINNMMKKFKKKKKKHHHHHHHHHHSSKIHLQQSNMRSTNQYQKPLTNTINNSTSNQETEEQSLNKMIVTNVNNNSVNSIDSIEDECSALSASLTAQESCHKMRINDELPVGQEPSIVATLIKSRMNNNIDDRLDNAQQLANDEDDDVIMSSVLNNQDSIFSSVDLMDIEDSCSKLDISALGLEADELNCLDGDVEDSRLSAALSNSTSMSMMNQREKRRFRQTSSVYRRLLQKGYVSCDSNNLYDNLRRKEKTMSMSIKSNYLAKHRKPSALQQFLTSLLKRLQVKDPNKLFSWPVIDSVTPGYSQVCPHPMDFNTIQKKIEHNCYESVAELKFDVRLLCENAIKYYRHSGLHYREASKLWYYAKTQIFSRDQLAEHLKLFPSLAMSDLGMDDPPTTTRSNFVNGVTSTAPTMAPTLNGLLNSSTSISTTANESNKTQSLTLKSLLNDTKCLVDDTSLSSSTSSEDLIKEARKCFIQTGDQTKSIPEFTVLHPPEDIALCRQQSDGSTSLPFLLPDYNGHTLGRKPQLTLGNMVGRLHEGTSSLSSYKELETDRIRPYRYLEETLRLPFVSHLPYMDSSTSTISHEDTNMLYSEFEKYNDDDQHQKEIERVVNDQNYLVKSFVDSILTTVSHGEYKPDQQKLDSESSSGESDNDQQSSSSKLLQSSQATTVNNTSEQDQKQKSENINQPEPRDSRRSSEETWTADEGMEDETDNALQKSLNLQNDLLKQLETTQYKRLSKTTEPIEPTENETKIAGMISNSLVDVIKQIKPSDIIESSTIHKYLGLTFNNQDNNNHADNHQQQVPMVVELDQTSSNK